MRASSNYSNKNPCGSQNPKGFLIIKKHKRKEVPMQSRNNLIDALNLVKLNYGKTAECSLCSQEIQVRKIKKHFLLDHQLKKVSRAVINQLSDSDQKLYLLFNNKTRRFTCEFCPRYFERISAWLNHLKKNHKIAVSGKIALMVDLHIKTLRAESDTRPDLRRRLVIESPQESTSL
jgi:hypothetical protein